MLGPVVHILFILVFPPLMIGIIAKTRAFFAGRKGPPILQLYSDIVKLFRKGLVISTTTSWVFWAGPVVTLVSVMFASAFIPVVDISSLIHFQGDFLLFAYLLGLARFFTTTAALDTGSSFEGMGAAREVTFSILTEPALFFALLVLTRMTGSLSLSEMLRAIPTSFSVSTVGPVALIAIGLFIILLAENSRIPVDDPATHLELTMIHEVMVLDHSGPLLGMIMYASALKLFILGTLITTLVFPFPSLTGPLAYVVFVLEITLVAVLIGVVESTMARLRMVRVPYLLVSSIILCSSALVFLVR
ncbi:NADH-quinone oxidoreductase subunit H [Marispirochaeta aestuarii]|uniref:respiratory chain complex I subunit 1 family protein n=1 Tax=Marispirochaeta aestuarii TaxID=1963862 RepID=UPI0029C731EF|nr:NADH-quinone oxidoreductase subunit H [Marispirochaeta aestuarii]